MGLDQYLEARKYVGGWSFRPIDEQNTYEDTLALLGLTKADIDPDASPVAIISVGIGYWRKANQVHNWFVNNVQNGEDDCKTYFVSREQLEELVDVCKNVKIDHSKAGELLPVGEGFFFGSYEYDEYYFGQIDNTIEMLEKILYNPKFAGDDWDFQYHSSW
jgi:hypothetical protein